MMDIWGMWTESTGCLQMRRITESMQKTDKDFLTDILEQQNGGIFLMGELMGVMQEEKTKFELSGLNADI